MYVSPAVRSIREHPVEGETVTVLVEATGEDALARLREQLSAVGTVEREREFQTLEVTVAHERIDRVCDLTGARTVETADTLGIDADGAGEDVRPGE
jgi:hypothetical protein